MLNYILIPYSEQHNWNIFVSKTTRALVTIFDCGLRNYIIIITEVAMRPFGISFWLVIYFKFRMKCSFQVIFFRLFTARDLYLIIYSCKQELFVSIVQC